MANVKAIMEWWSGFDQGVSNATTITIAINSSGVGVGLWGFRVGSNSSR